MSKKLITKVSTTVVSIATIVSLSGAGALLPMTAFGGATVAELQAQINALLAQIQTLQAQLTASSGVSGSVPASLLSSGNLTLGSKGAAVMDLQKFLNANSAQVAASGAGSSGSETEYFGSLTKAALAKWQAANGVSPAAGYFGPITRAKLASLPAGAAAAPAAAVATPATPAVVVPVGSGLTVTLAADQPASTLAVNDASRVPFTKLALTASSDGDVTVNSITVQRTGLAADSALASVILVDENGNQLGLKKTLNSDHQATVGEPIVVKAGQTRYVTVAGTRGNTSSYAGQTLALTVVKVNTSANVNGSFPLVGTTHTVNETLTIGSMTMAKGSMDPGSSQTKEIGTTGYVFSSIKVTAGSAEKIYLKSVRWNQTGSASKTDLANVKTYIDGVGYEAVVSADGKYYTSNFNVLVDKGFNKEIYIKGDVVSGSSRTIQFDIAKMTDVYAVGETYGYGIIPPQTNSCGATTGTSCFTSTEDPWWDSAMVTVSHGTLTVTNWTTGVPAQNVAINLSNQLIAGWSVEVKGEAVSVSSLKVDLYETNTTNGVDDLSNISLVDSTGKVLAGPIDVTSTALAYATITFTDTISFPVGVTNMILKGKLGTGFSNNDTITASTTPSGWTSTGGTTGDTITPTPSTALTGPTMTAKGLALTISVQSTPGAQSIVGGNQGFEFARYTFDASQSGEDAQMSSVNLAVDYVGGITDKLSGCKLYDGTTALTTGSNVVDPTASASSSLFTFDTPLVVARGTSKTLSLKCDTSTVADATLSYRWGIDTDASFTVNGLTSGQSITNATVVPAANNSVGNLMTLTTGGSYTVVDDSTDNYHIVVPGEEVTLGKLKFTASIEDVDIRRVALQLTGAASNTPKDLLDLKVKLYDQANPSVLLGTAEFVNEGDTATSTEFATGAFKVTKGSSNAKTLLIRGTMAGIGDTTGGTVQLTKSGDFLKVDYDGDATGLANGNYGVGSAGNVTGPTSDTALPGVRLMKAKPIFAKLSLPSNKINGNGIQSIYRFSVTASGGDIALAKLTFEIGSSTVAATTSVYSLYAWTKSDFTGSTPGWTSDGLFNYGSCVNGKTNTDPNDVVVEIYANKTACLGSGTTTLKVPSGQTYYFDLRATFGNVRTTTGSETVTVQLDGDSAFPVNHQSTNDTGEMGSSGILLADTGVEDASDNDLIWSPLSTTTPDLNTNDWTNGYEVSGLPVSNMTQEPLTYIL